MKLQAYICPQCGGSLQVEEGTTITTCPNCGNQIHIIYDNDENMNNTKAFTTTEGLLVASAIVPDNYELSASINYNWQSEFVPLTTFIRAMNKEGDIVLASSSKEMFHDVRSALIKGIHALLQTHTRNGYTKYIDAESYIKSWAEKMSGTSLNLEATTDLPSQFGKHPEYLKEAFNYDLSLYNRYMEMTFQIKDMVVDEKLYKYSGILNGDEIVVLAAADYIAAELKSPLSPGFGNIGDALGNLSEAFGGNGKERIAKLSSGLNEFKDKLSHVASGKDKMSMDDWMKGGILGKMMRDKKNKNEEENIIKEDNHKEEISEDIFGYRKHVDQVSYGAYRKYICICLKEKEEAATNIFLRFLNSIKQDANIANKEASMIQAKFEQLQKEVAMNQAKARQMQMQTQRLQQQTSQMIANNARSASEGLMDSWNKKMASESHISSAYSEAIRGVDTYVNSSGQEVEVGLSADHVYQNTYGDTYGISGTDIDESLANQLNWTKLDKKD